MERVFIMHLFIISLLSQAAAEVYNRPLSESQTFYIPSDAVNNDVVGTVLAYPEFHEIGSAPTFVLKRNVDNIYAVLSSGIITIADRRSLAAGDDIIVITAKKNGYVDKDIRVTITVLSTTTSTIFIDPESTTNGTGTRVNPRNSIPNLNNYNGYKYWFKRGTTLTLTSQMASVGSKSNLFFSSYGQGPKARLTGNKIRILSFGTGCSNITISELEFDAINPAADGSNWLTTPVYYASCRENMILSHCTISHGLTASGSGGGFSKLSYLFNYVRNTKVDGFYLGYITGYAIVIGNDIARVNWDYQFLGSGEIQSPGDGIQFTACENVLARGNYIDHSLFGNKFCIILDDGTNNRYIGEVTDNYCISPPNNTGIYVQGYATGTRISRNYVEGGAQCISYAGGGGVLQIDYNVVKSPYSRGIYGGTSNLYNNTIYGCPTGIYGHVAGYAAKNNLFYFTSSSQVAYNDAGNATYDYNLYSDQHTNMFGSGRSAVAGQTGEDHSVIGNPSFVTSADLHLDSISLCINAGVDVGLNVDKDSVSIIGKPDLGAYEYYLTSPATIIPGYQDRMPEDFINLFPNPNDGRFSIDILTSLTHEKKVLTIINMTGEIMYREVLYNEENFRQFDLSYLISGMYTLIISCNEIVATKKIIKN
jgi:hypothetical protein